MKLKKRTPSLSRGQYSGTAINTGSSGGGGISAMAHGGMVKPGEPFIAGDPQADGKANPEVIIPTAKGTHVIPMKSMRGARNLRKCAYGTFSANTGFRSNLAEIKWRAFGGPAPARATVSDAIGGGIEGARQIAASDPSKRLIES